MSFLFRKDRLISINPATLEAVGEVAITFPEHVQAVVEEAKKGQEAWQTKTLHERADIIKRAGECFFENRE
jgi:acyl-CoA reductase-like NAD-dependent aldehyde dehydrogenase